MDFSKFEKGINKAASVCANQSGCDDEFLLCIDEIKEIEDGLFEIQSDKRTSELENAKIKEFLARLQNTKKSINQIEKRLFFAYDALNIKRVSHDEHIFKDTRIRANGKIKAVEIALDLLKVKDKEKFIGDLISIDKHGISIKSLVDITNTKEKQLKQLALNNPWLFYCVLVGAKTILK